MQKTQQNKEGGCWFDIEGPLWRYVWTLLKTPLPNIPIVEDYGHCYSQEESKSTSTPISISKYFHSASGYIKI